MRIQPDATWNAASESMTKLLENRNVVNINRQAEVHTFADFIKGDTVRRKQNILWIESRFDTQHRFLDRNGVKPRSQRFHITQDIQVAERLAGKFHPHGDTAECS